MNMTLEHPCPPDFDGFYGVLPPRSQFIEAAIAQNPDFLHLKQLFPFALRRLDPMNMMEAGVQHHAFPALLVFCVIRGKVERVMSVSAYADHARLIFESDGLPNGC